MLQIMRGFNVSFLQMRQKLLVASSQLFVRKQPGPVCLAILGVIFNLVKNEFARQAQGEGTGNGKLPEMTP